jgi:hypothetical protein
VNTTEKPAPTLHLDIDEALLSVEYSLPHVEENLEEQAEAERERYDEQILAALVSP